MVYDKPSLEELAYMYFKKLLGVICAFVILFSAGAVMIASAREVYASENTYYYGTSLVTAGEGSTTITSSLSNGVEITFKIESDASSASYRHSLDMNKFAVDFRFGNANFEELWFTFSDADNSSKWVTIWLKQNGDDLQYKFEDNYGNTTSYINSDVTVTQLTSDAGVTLSYTKDGGFVFGSTALSADGMTTLTFYKNIADMSFGVEGVSDDDDDEDAVMYITAITSSNGTQTLITSNNRFSDDDRIAPVIISKVDGDDAIVTSADPINATVNAASNSTYTFPYHCLDILGTGWSVTTTVDSGSETSVVEGKTNHSLGTAGKTYVFKIYAKSSDATPIITLTVTAVNDEAAVTINNDALMAFLQSSEEIGNNGAGFADHIVAPSENNTFEFPHIYADDFSTIFTASDGIDAYYNVTIQVGYRAPGDTGEFTYVDAYAVKINEVGMWSFRYRVVDAAGNITESETFQLRVLDETAPTITTESLIEIPVNEEYTIPSATITDNAAGVDTSYSTWTLYYMNADGTKGDVIENLTEDDEGYEDSILKDGVLTPTELTDSDCEGSFILVYEARDLSGNVAESVEVILKVVEGDLETNPWNEFFVTALIVVACLAGTGIIILIFFKPKERELR